MTAITTSASTSMAAARSILIVDDDPDAREILVRILANLGEQSRVAANGREALMRVAEEVPALIFMDLMMPEMSGFEAIVKLKREVATRDIPIVIVSALGGDQRLVRMGASHVVPKGSLSVPEVKRILAKVLPRPVIDSAAPEKPILPIPDRVSGEMPL